MKMTNNFKSCKFLAVVALPLSLVTVDSLGNIAQAQIIPDRTMGKESSTVVPLNEQAERIEGGAARGSNLFHSFREFNIAEGRGAYFANPAAIENIFSRVTGSNPSRLLGTLGVLGDANLFFLNPNGIIFGKNASLDIRGSLVTSTANSLIFPDGERFSATNPQAPPLLEVDAPIPIGLQFEGEELGAIINAGELEAGGNLTLIGGTVASTGKLLAPGELISVAGVPEASLIKLGTEGQLLGWERSPTTNDSEVEVGSLSLPELLTRAGDETGLQFTSDGQMELVESGIRFSANPGTAIVSGNIDASNTEPGQTGGKVSVLGDRVGLFDKAQINVSGNAGGGTVLIGGDFQGKGEVPNAARTYIAADVNINADALTQGDGGRVIVWADEVTGFYGNISASGGVNSGNGGFVEVSGKEQLIFRGNVDTNAISGFPGTLLLDPANINIANGTGDEESDGTDTFAGNNSGVVGSILSPTPFPLNEINDTAPTTIYESELEGLSGDTNIKLQATNNITLQDLTDNELTLQAGLSLITFTADADKNGVGNFLMIGAESDTINTNRRPIFIEGANLTLGNINTSGRRGGRTILLEAKGDILTGDLNASSSDSSNQDDIITRGGQVTLEADGDITVKGSINSSSKYNTSTSIPAADGGEITLKAVGNIGVEGKINSRSSSGLNSTDSPSGNGGEITLSAYNGSINVKGDIESSSTAETGLIGNGGVITLTADNDAIAGNIDSTSSDILTGRPRAGKFGTTGNGGAISVTATNGNIQTGNINSSSAAAQTAAGDGGDITLTAKNNLTTGEINSSASVVGLEIPTGAAFLVGPGYDPKNIRGSGGKIQLVTEGDISVGSINARGKNGGRIIITNPVSKLELNNIIVDSSTTGGTIGEEEAGAGGEIRFDAPLVELTNVEVKSTAINAGEAGNIFVNSPGSLFLNNSRLFTALELGAKGTGGKIEINAPKVEMTNFSLIDTATFGVGNAGELIVKADNFSLTNSNILSITAGTGNAGKITITGNSNDVSNQVFLANQSNISTAVDAGAVGNGNEVKIESHSLSLTGGSQISALTRGTGESGNIQFNLGDTLNIADIGEDRFVSGVFTSSEASNSGTGGDINVNNTSGKLNVSISDGGVLNAQTFSNADGGDINVNANTVELSNGGGLLTNTFSSGKAGSITVNATKKVVISGTDPNFANQLPPPRPKITSPSTLSETTQLHNSVATAQEIRDDDFSINSPTNVNPNVELATGIPYVSIAGEGDGEVDYYSINVKTAGARAIFDIDEGATIFGGGVPLELTLFDSQGNRLASNSIASSSLGAGGSESADDPYLRYVFPEPGRYFIRVKEDSFLGSGNGIPNGATYKLQISLGSPNVRGVNTEEASGLFAQTQADGAAGNATIITPQLTVQDGARVSAFTSGSGRAGSLTINAPNSVKITGTGGLLVQATPESESTAGDLTLTTGELTLAEGASVTVSSENGLAGNVNITADSIFQNQGTIAAETGLSDEEGANVNLLKISDIWRIENESLVSATALGDADGGNVNINTKFIVAFPPTGDEGSDIIANAFEGNGGRIDITAAGIFGIEFRDRRTPLNDFTVSSVFGAPGAFDDEILEIDPTRGLIILPEETVNTQISQGCQTVRGKEAVEYFEIGRGGLPPNPSEPLNADAVLEDWIELEPKSENGSDSGTNINSPQPDKTELILPCPAQ